MSTVYLARSPAGEPLVAKVLTPHGGRIADKLSTELAKPWEGERALALVHPHIVRTFACGREKGRYYLLMEHLPGGSLAERLRARNADVLARRLEILIGAANGLAYVHEKGIIHRDICAENLMFDSQRSVKLIDFGVAVHENDRLRRTEVRTGRSGYMAPELIREHRFDVQTDVYAFGVILYEAFAGRKPFLGESPEELMTLRLRHDPLPPSRVDPSVGPEVDRVVLRALSRDPAERHANMVDLGAALGRLRATGGRARDPR